MLLFLCIWNLFLGHEQMPATSAVVKNKHQIIFGINAGGTEVELNKAFVINANDTVRLEKLKIYISHANIGTSTEVQSLNYHLFDFSLANTLSIPCSGKPESFTFTLGIDSATNASGVMPGPLDPMHGMYWTWQSGYIHIKLEGQIASPKKNTEQFTYHIGGYQYPYACYTDMHFKQTLHDSMQISFDIEKFLSSNTAKRTKKVMSPGQDAFELFDDFANALSVQQ